MIRLTANDRSEISRLYGENFKVAETLRWDDRTLYFKGFQVPTKGGYYLALDSLGAPFTGGERPIEFWSGDTFIHKNPKENRHRLVYTFEEPAATEPSFTVSEIAEIIKRYGFFPQIPGETPVAYREVEVGEYYYNTFAEGITYAGSGGHVDLVFVKDAPAKKKKKAAKVTKKEEPVSATTTRSGC
jgi:hypothetical protein